jgi:predicted transport protein
MSPLLIVVIVILGLEFVALIGSLITHIVRDNRKLKALQEKISNSITTEDIENTKREVFGIETPVAEVKEEQPEEKVVEPEVVAEEIVQEKVEIVEEKVEKPKKAKKAKKEQPAPVVAEVKEEVAANEDEEESESDLDAELGERPERADSKSRIPFADKMIYLDKKTQGYYNAIMNKFKGLRKMNVRISTKGVSFRLGRDLIAKLTVRGKTLRLHLALDVNAYDAKVYFHKDLGDVKSYVEVPFAVKIKSDRGLKNALKLIDDMIAGKGIEEKTRFNETDGVEDLKVIALKNRK